MLHFLPLYTEHLSSHERTKVFPTSSSPPCCSLSLDSCSSQFWSWFLQISQWTVLTYYYVLFYMHSTYVHTDVGAKGSIIGVFLCCFLLFFSFFLSFLNETGSLTELGTYCFSQAGWLVSPKVLLSLPPKWWEYRLVSPYLAFVWMLEFQTQDLLLPHFTH